MEVHEASPYPKPDEPDLDTTFIQTVWPELIGELKEMLGSSISDRLAAVHIDEDSEHSHTTAESGEETNDDSAKSHTTADTGEETEEGIGVGEGEVEENSEEDIGTVYNANVQLSPRAHFQPPEVASAVNADDACGWGRQLLTDRRLVLIL